MILRTPPPQKRSRSGSATSDGGGGGSTPVSDRRLAVVDAALPIAERDPDDLVCTYQCRQMVKSEFIHALNSAEKQVNEYQSKLDALNKKYITSEDERQKFHDRLLLLEQEVAASKGREQALQGRLLKEVADSQKQYQVQAKHISELELQLKKEKELRLNAESMAAAANEKAAGMEEGIERLSESAEKEKKRLLKELSESQTESKLSYSRLNMELDRMRVRADCAVEESELLQKQIDSLKEQLNEKSRLEEEMKILISKTHNVAPSEDQNLVKHLQEELRNYEAEVQEARKLKSSHVNVELLKERLLEEKVHRERAEAELSKLREVELNSIKLQDELMTLKLVAKEIPGISSLEEVPDRLAALQKEALVNLKKVGEITERLNHVEVELDMAYHTKQNAVTESALCRKKIEELTLEVKHLKQMLKSVTEERDRLRRAFGTPVGQKSGDPKGGTVDESLLKGESPFFEAESPTKELENNLQKQSEIINNQREEIMFLNEKLSTEAKRIKSLERENDRLGSEISLLESKIGHGDYSAANTKVLRMVNTLGVDNEAKHTIEALRAELHKAQEKLQAIEELKGQSDAGNVIDANISEKLAQLKGQIATLEKREERYKAVFADKISVFRRACCSLFGYKIIMDEQQGPSGIPVTRFILQSIYALNDDEKLEFEYESGNMNILANDYTSQQEISRQVEVFIRKMSSIPAFTANLTVESFNRRTLS